MITIQDLSAVALSFDRLKSKLITDVDSFWFGMPGHNHKWGGNTLLTSSILLYCEPGSDHYMDSDTLLIASNFVKTLLNQQNDAGLISLYDCNIDSPPDTAFKVNCLAICRKYLIKKKIRATEPLIETITEFMLNAGKGLADGGFHTPNHRWVLCAALSHIAELYPDKTYKVRIDEFLSEGLDINEDGEWTEKSNATYNAVCDLFLFHLNEHHPNPEILKCIRSNLDMMKLMIQPDFSIVTEYSTRQDRLKRAYLNEDYAIIYKLMSIRDNDAEYSYLAKIALQYVDNPSLHYLYDYLYDFKAINERCISTKYEVLLNKGEKNNKTFGDPVLRFRSNDLSMTLIENQSDFMSIQVGGIKIKSIRLVAGWFGVAQISFKLLRRISRHRYQMQASLAAHYLDSLEKSNYPVHNKNYSQLPNHKRNKINRLTLDVGIEVELSDSTVKLRTVCNTMPNILLQVVLLIDKGCLISGNGLETADPFSRFFCSNDMYIQKDNDKMRISGGEKQHGAINLRNYTSDEHSDNILINYLSPYDKEIVFEKV